MSRTTGLNNRSATHAKALWSIALTTGAITFAGCAAPAAPEEATAETPAAGQIVDVDTQQAALVIDGEVLATACFPSDTIGMYTLVKIRVSHAIKGAVVGQEVVVQVRGGRIGDAVTTVTHQPSFAEGEHVRLYLDALFDADREAIAATGSDWTGGATVMSVRNGARGKQRLVQASRAGVSQVEAALLSGCTSSSGYCIDHEPFDFGTGQYKYYINPNTSDTGGIEMSVQMGLQAWEIEPSSRIDFAYMGHSSQAGYSNDSVNVVFWSNTLIPPQYVAQTAIYSDCPNGGADPTLCKVKGFDMGFNDMTTWGIYTNTLIEHTAMHEAGHALGFEHVSDTNQIMFPNYQPMIALGWGDRAGAQAAYPAGEIPVVGDFNGDGKDDIMTFVNDAGGKVYVALNTGSSFGSASIWGTNVAVRGQLPKIGDFNGDGKDDIVAFTQAPSEAWVCLSSGSMLIPCTRWSTYFGLVGETPMVGDFNGDGKDDIVVFVKGVLGTVYVALSNGSSFGAAALWNSWFSPGDEVAAVGDFNGDAKDDIVTFDDTGLPWVSLSTGSSFPGATPWGGAGSCFATNFHRAVIGDIDGDRRADLLCFFAQSQPGGVGQAGVALSQGNNFASTGRYTGFFVPFYNKDLFIGRFPTQGAILEFDRCSSADVFVLTKAGAIAWNSPAKWHDFFAPGPCP